MELRSHIQIGSLLGFVRVVRMPISSVSNLTGGGPTILFSGANPPLPIFFDGTEKPYSDRNAVRFCKSGAYADLISVEFDRRWAHDLVLGSKSAFANLL